MKKFKKLLLFLFLSFSLSINIAIGQTIDSGELKIIKPPDVGHICSLSPTDANAHLSIVPDNKVREKLNRTKASMFETDYRIDIGNSCGYMEWPQAAKDAFEYTLNLWSAYLRSDIPIKIQAFWRNIESDHRTILGSAGPTRIVQLPDMGIPDTWYSLAQLSAMSGRVLRDQIEGVDHDLTVNINCGFDGWYFGTDAVTPQNRIDFVTVVLHEIMHGVVYFGSMSGDNENGTGKWGLPVDNPMPFIFDKFAVDSEGIPLLNSIAYPNPSDRLYDALTSRTGNIFFDGEDANSTQAGDYKNPAMLYAPREFRPGSSFSHIDQITFTGTADALMRPNMDYALAIHTPGPLLCGMLSDMGWPLDTGCLSFFTADAQIAISETKLDFGVTNIGRATQKSFIITNDITSSETLAGFIETTDEYFAMFGEYTFNLDPGTSATFTVQHTAEIENRHTGTLSVYHNARNLESPILLSLRGEVLTANQIVKLDQSFPNPVVPGNPVPLIPFAIAMDADVTLDLYTITGRHIQSLINSRHVAGRYEVEANTVGLSSGIYIYRIVVNDVVESRKLLLIN